MNIRNDDFITYYNALLGPMKQWQLLLQRAKTVEDKQRIKQYLHGAWTVMVHLRETHVANVYLDVIDRIDSNILDQQLEECRADSMCQQTKP